MSVSLSKAFNYTTDLIYSSRRSLHSLWYVSDVSLFCRTKGLTQFWMEIRPSREVLGRMWSWTLPAVFPIIEIKCWGWRFGLDFGLVSAQSVPSSSSSERLRTTLWQSISLFNLLKGSTLLWYFEINPTAAIKQGLVVLYKK